MIAEFVRTNDQNVLAELYSRYIELVYGVCLFYLKDRHRASDETMSIYVQLVKKLHRQEIKNFKSWLHVLTKNHCLGILRKAKRERMTLSLDPSFMHLDEALHPIEEKEREDGMEQHLENCLEQLNPIQKQVLLAFYFEGNSYLEIAQANGWDINKVRSNMQNGRRNLKNCIQLQHER